MFNYWLDSQNVVMVIFDTLRYDIADELWRTGRTPFLKSLIPQGWEKRHSPGSFTFAAHQAFFAGFLPTPADSTAQRNHRLPWCYDKADIVRGLSSQGLRTICIGGVGFFNMRNDLGKVLPGYFDEAYYSDAMSVTDRNSIYNQVDLACKLLSQKTDQRFFLFINVPTVHFPNYFYIPGVPQLPVGTTIGPNLDTLASHAAAFEFVDAALPPLFDAVRKRGPAVCLLGSDHGTTYGEDGFKGHRLAHEKVWTVPWAQLVL